MSDDINRMLGQIDGKLDSVIKALDRHIDDDVRRFTEVYVRLDATDRDINQAKGAKGAILWAAGLVAALVGSVATIVGKKLGLL